MPVHIALRME